jgi:hypothetical protein
MKHDFTAGMGARIAAAALAFGCNVAVAQDAESQDEAASSAATVERGRYLVTTSGCNDCHTPWTMGANGPEPDISRMLSGHPEAEKINAGASLAEPWVVAASPTNTAWSGPWGVSFTANLTPDTETGLGKWTLEMFKDTIRTGRHKGRGRLVLPPMPIPMYKHFTDPDLEAIFTFLQSIPAVRNQVPEPLPPT